MKSIIAKTSILALSIACATAALAPAQAQAAPMQCGSVPVTMVAVDKSGTVLASFAGIGNNLALCSVDTASNGWTASACKALLSELNAALLSGKKAQPFWDSTKKNNCTVIPDWTNISSSFGFYFSAFSN